MGFKILDIILVAVAVAGITSTIILVLEKYDLLDRYMARRYSWMPRVCLLCLCFWLCVLLTLLLSWYYSSPMKWHEIGLVGLIGAAWSRKIIQGFE